jgi:hypothetical protein
MKRTILLLLLSGASACAATVENEEKLLNEIISDELEESGIDCPLSFRGTLNLTVFFVSQDLKGNNENRVLALESDIFLKYLSCEC